MNIKEPLFIAAITLFFFTSTTVFAQEGHLRVKNCSNVTIYVATADWVDPLGWVPYAHNAKWLKPNKTHTFHCRKTWMKASAPGCEVILRNKDMPRPIRILRKSGHYIVSSNGYLRFKKGSTCN